MNRRKQNKLRSWVFHGCFVRHPDGYFCTAQARMEMGPRWWPGPRLFDDPDGALWQSINGRSYQQ